MNRQSITICPTRIYLFPAPLNAGSSSSSQASSINVLSKHTRCPNWNEKRTRVPLFQHKMYKLNSWNWSLNQLSKLNPQVDPFLSSSTTWLYACTFIVELLAQHLPTIEFTDYGHTKAKSLILWAQIQIPIPNIYLECGYKGLVFCKNNGWIFGKHGQGCTKMGANSSAENSPNAPEFICPICLPSSGFQF